MANEIVGDPIPLMLEVDATCDPRLTSGVLVGFGLMREYDERKRDEVGHPVMGDPIVFFACRVPGDTKSFICNRATEKNFARFPKAYAAFQQRETKPIDGMPIEAWPQITRAEALLLKRQDIHTVETLAAIHDGHIGNLGHQGRIWRSKAQAFLELAQDTALAQKQAAELAKRDEQLAEMVRQQERTNKLVLDLQARLDGRGKRKEEAAA